MSRQYIELIIRPICPHSCDLMFEDGHAHDQHLKASDPHDKPDMFRVLCTLLLYIVH